MLAGCMNAGLPPVSVSTATTTATLDAVSTG